MLDFDTDRQAARAQAERHWDAWNELFQRFPRASPLSEFLSMRLADPASYTLNQALRDHAKRAVEVRERRGADRGCVSGSARQACLMGMHIVYVVVTILAALANSYAAGLSIGGAASVKAIAEKVQVSQRWMRPFGVLLAAGAVGLLIGFAVPAVGVLAATGLVLYFIGALSAHIRVRDAKVGGAVSFLILAVAALMANLVYHSQ